MTDVLIRQTDDGGEISFFNGEPVTSDGLDQAVYLSLFGGNQDDSGSDGDKPNQWWGNWDEPDPTRQYRSATQNLVESIPAVPANLKRVEDAASGDLAWFTETGLATGFRVRATMPGINRIALEVFVEIDGRVNEFRFTQPWSNKQ
jgi:phage gp46-like protein